MARATTPAAMRPAVLQSRPIRIQDRSQRGLRQRNQVRVASPEVPQAVVVLPPDPVVAVLRAYLAVQIQAPDRAPASLEDPAVHPEQTPVLSVRAGPAQARAAPARVEALS
jgi:hypothetical protein